LKSKQLFCWLALAEGQAGSALETVMRIWTERQIELRGVYEINLTSTALATLLASRHPALAEAKARNAFSCWTHSPAAIAASKYPLWS